MTYLHHWKEKTHMHIFRYLSCSTSGGMFGKWLCWWNKLHHFFSWNNDCQEIFEAWNSHGLKCDSRTFTLTSYSKISNATIISKETEINYFNSSKLSTSAFLCHNEGFAVPILKYMELKFSMQNGIVVAEPWNISFAFLRGVITLMLYFCA